MDHTQSPVLDRFFAAAALARQLLSEAQLAELLDAWPQPPKLALAEFAVEKGAIPKTEIKGFYAFLDRCLGADSADVDEMIARQTIGLIRKTLDLATHPTIRAFLSGRDGRSVPSQLIKAQNFYRTVELKGEGAMGRVWLAHDIALDRPVGLKQLKVGDVHPDARQRFIREAQITGQLQHPSIVPLYRMGVDSQSDEIFYTMRFLSGRTLSEHVAEFQKAIASGERNRVALNQLLVAYLGACQAIHYAHSRGIVHRDLKPANIMIGDFGEAIVLDWGLAKRLHAMDDPAECKPDSAYKLAERAGDDATQVGTILGTPAFMAPEQAIGNSLEIGPATDVFALGGILFHILTGSSPHVFKKGGTAPEFALQIALTPPPLARTLAPWSPPALEAICAKAMALKVADRYADVGALMDDVRRWIAGDAVSVYPESQWRTLARWAMRRQLRVATAATFLLALLVTTTMLIGYEWANAINLIRVAQEQLRDVSMNFAADTHYMLLLRAESTRFLSRQPQSKELAAQWSTAGPDERQRMLSATTDSLIPFLDTRTVEHVVSILEAKGSGEILRVRGPVPSVPTKGETLKTPTLAPDKSADVLAFVRHLPPDKVYLAPLERAEQLGDAKAASPNCTHWAPIYDANQQVVGAFGNEANFVPRFGAREIVERGQTSAINTFVADGDDGSILFGSLTPESGIPDSSRKAHLITELFPELQPIIADKGRQTISVADSERHGQIVFATRLNVGDCVPPRGYIHVSSIAMSHVVAESERRLIVMAIVIVVLIAVAVAFAVIGSRLFARIAADWR